MEKQIDTQVKLIPKSLCSGDIIHNIGDISLIDEILDIAEEKEKNNKTSQI